MSEAGLTVAKPGYQWRLVGQRSSENYGRGIAGPVGGRRLELAKAAALTCSGGNGLWRSARQSVRRMARGLRQEAYGAISPGLRTAENADAGRLPKTTRVSGRTALVAAAGRRGVNHVTTQGRRYRKRLSDIVEDGSVLLLALRRRQEDRAGRDGPGGVSRGLGSWDPSGCS
jgi:hypothetical protein